MLEVFETSTGWQVAYVDTASRTRSRHVSSEITFAECKARHTVQWLLQGTYAEPVFAVLDENVAHPTVLLEELFQIPFTNVVGQISQKHSTAFARGHFSHGDIWVPKLEFRRDKRNK